MISGLSGFLGFEAEVEMRDKVLGGMGHASHT